MYYKRHYTIFIWDEPHRRNKLRKEGYHPYLLEQEVTWMGRHLTVIDHESNYYYNTITLKE